MAGIYCKDHFKTSDKAIARLKGKCPGEWAKVVSGWSKHDIFCDECNSSIGVGDPARYLIYLAPSLRDPMTESGIFQVNGQVEKNIRLD